MDSANKTFFIMVLLTMVCFGITLYQFFNPKENIISKYGKSSPAEFFAECFAEYECDGTTVYAKAMEEFLKKRGFIK